MNNKMLYLMSGFMDHAMNAEPTGKSYRERAKEVNTPGNFKKCPKGAQEFKFGYAEDGEFTCYARTKEAAYRKYKNFLNKR